MISVGKWRWPLVLLLPMMVASLLLWRGVGRLIYSGRMFMAFSGDGKQIDQELKFFRSDNLHQRLAMALGHPAGPLTVDKIPGRPLELSITSEALRSKEVVTILEIVGKVIPDQSLARQKADLHKQMEPLQKAQLEWQGRLDPLLLERKTLSSSRVRPVQNSDTAILIDSLRVRRQFLISHYPSHTDIALLAKQIKDLENQSRPRSSGKSSKLSDLHRRVNETQLWIAYYSGRLKDLGMMEQSLKPAWSVAQAVQKPTRPARMEQWPLFSGSVLGTFLLGFLLLKSERVDKKNANQNGLWRPDVSVVPEPLQAPLETPVELKVVPPEAELPSDPLIEKAGLIYTKWIEVSKVLYTPATEPPQGILDSVGPLLQESSDFLPEGHDVMARYLAQHVTPGDLPAHVARTVLMTLTGAAEAGASPEHRLAMALAALFHDLAMVPRPTAIQEDAGSEVGRLSASVLRRIPGLQPALLSMVEDILIGMDEFKLETWHNAATGRQLEPLSKVLREIDRFEKVMQKQRSRLDRRVANQ